MPFFLLTSWEQTEMERQRRTQASLPIWALVAALLSQNLVIPVLSTASVEDQKNYYSPDPHAGTPPTGSHHSPSHGTPPSHGSGGSYGGTPPYHGTPSPSHGGGGGSYGGTPPANCGSPPSGGHHDPSPPPPTGGGGGGYYPSPSTPTYGGTPPSTPTIVSPPSTPTITPVTPSTPPFSVPSPPFDPNSPPPFDPNSPPFPCTYWRTHPGLIWGLLGWFGTVGGAFGVTSVPGFGANPSLLEALSNNRPDGLGALYREGTASLLNSMMNKRFPYTTKQVRDNFVAALHSNKAAAAQAQLFKLANEGRLKPRD